MAGHQPIHLTLSTQTSSPKEAGPTGSLGRKVYKSLHDRLADVARDYPRTYHRRQPHRNHVWAWDFVSDYTQLGGRLRAFNLIDEFTRECHCIHADRTIKAADVLAVLQEAIEEQGAPEYIRSDNGPEFIAKIIQQWLRENNIKALYIDPGVPDRMDTPRASTTALERNAWIVN